MTEKMKMNPAMEFHRAHCFGSKSKIATRDGTVYETKPIVCRFKNFKDREVARKAARELKRTRYGVSEQFPKEINDRRKLPWPYVSKKIDAKTKKHISKKIYFTLTATNLYTNLILPKKQLIGIANNYVNTQLEAPVHKKNSADHLMVAETNTPLVTRDIINEDR
jgi:hypothetical protein